MPDALSLSRTELPEEIATAIRFLTETCLFANRFNDAALINRNVRNGVDALTAAILSRLGEAEAQGAPSGTGCRPSDQTPSGSGGKAASIPRAEPNSSDAEIYERAIARANERIQAEIEREGYPPSAQYLAAIGVSEGLRLAAIAASVREGEHKEALLEAQRRVRESDLYAIEGLIPVQQPHHIGPGWGHYVQALREAVKAVRAAPYRRAR